MSDCEFFGKIKAQRLTSLEEDSRRGLEEFRKDELERAIRRSGKQTSAPRETSYERFPEEG